MASSDNGNKFRSRDTVNVKKYTIFGIHSKVRIHKRIDILVNY
jgi:hypothetical protein